MNPTVTPAGVEVKPYREERVNPPNSLRVLWYSDETGELLVYKGTNKFSIINVKSWSAIEFQIGNDLDYSDRLSACWFAKLPKGDKYLVGIGESATNQSPYLVDAKSGSASPAFSEPSADMIWIQGPPVRVNDRLFCFIQHVIDGETILWHRDFLADATDSDLRNAQPLGPLKALSSAGIDLSIGDPFDVWDKALGRVVGVAPFGAGVGVIRSNDDWAEIREWHEQLNVGR